MSKNRDGASAGHRERAKVARPAPTRARTIRFGDEAWDAVGVEAEHLNVSTSQFIRDAVLVRMAYVRAARKAEPGDTLGLITNWLASHGYDVQPPSSEGTAHASSRENVEVERKPFEAAAAAWNRGDIDELMAAYHPDAVLVLNGGLESLVGREFHGREQVREFFEACREAFKETRLDVEQALPTGERILLIESQRNDDGWVGGVNPTLRWGNLLSFQDGLIIRSENYYEVDEALEAAGLPELVP